MKRIFCLAIAIGISTLFSFQQKPKFSSTESIARGKNIYIAQCITCHMEQGEGIDGVYPPLAKADYLMADKKRSIQQVLYGANGEMKVNGKVYNAEMSAFDLTDQQASDVLNYIRHSFGNKGGVITPEEVKAARKK